MGFVTRLMRTTRFCTRSLLRSMGSRTLIVLEVISTTQQTKLIIFLFWFLTLNTIITFYSLIFRSNTVLFYLNLSFVSILFLGFKVYTFNLVDSNKEFFFFSFYLVLNFQNVILEFEPYFNLVNKF